MVVSTSSSDGTILAVHVPSPPTHHGATTRHSVRLYDAAFTHRLKTTLVATVDSADGPIVELALESTAPSSSPSSSASPSPYPSVSAPPTFLAARLTSGSESHHPDKIVVWDLRRGVVGCNLSSPPSCVYSAVCVHDGRLYALTANRESGKIVVLEHDLVVSPTSTMTTTTTAEAVGRLRKRIKCSSIDADELFTTTKLGMTISDDGARLAVRLGDSIRLIDVETGRKLSKCKVRGDDVSSSSSSSASAAATAAPVVFSSDSVLVATVTTSGLSVFSSVEGGKAIHTIPYSSSSSHGGTIGSATIRNIEGGRYAFLTVVPTAGMAFLSEGTATPAAPTGAGSGKKKKGSSSKKRGDSGGDTVKTLATLRCASDRSGVVEATFHPTSPGGKVVALTMSTVAEADGSVTTSSRSAAGGTAEIHEVGYRDEDGNVIQGDIIVGSSADDADGSAIGDDDDDGNRKRRKAALPSGQLVLGPGEGGGESLTVTDRSAKRAKVNEETIPDADDNDDNDEDDDGFVLPDDDAIEEAAGGTIAERLAKLTAEMERDDTDDEDEVSEDEDARAALFGGVKGKKKIKPTSESLSTLLRQALSSNDDGQLEVALHVSDKKVIENTVAALARDDEIAEAEDDEGRGGMIIALLSKLVIRLARKPGRAEELSVWIRTVLLALISSSSGGKRMSKTERDVASRLAPLRNLLNERVESLPHLLRLEGRLSLLGQQL